MNECIFCKIVRKELDAYMVYEDEDMCCFLDIEPINSGHVLIIPKAHYLDIDEMENELIHRIMDLAKELVIILKEVYKPDGYSIMQNGGVFNDIGHFHLHVFPRYNQDGFGWKFREGKENIDLGPILKNLISHLKKPI